MLGIWTIFLKKMLSFSLSEMYFEPFLKVNSTNCIENLHLIVGFSISIAYLSVDVSGGILSYLTGIIIKCWLYTIIHCLHVLYIVVTTCFVQVAICNLHKWCDRKVLTFEICTWETLLHYPKLLRCESLILIEAPMSKKHCCDSANDEMEFV